MVKDHTDIKRGNLLPQQGFFYMYQDNTCHILCYTSCGALALMMMVMMMTMFVISNNIFMRQIRYLHLQIKRKKDRKKTNKKTAKNKQTINKTKRDALCTGPDGAVVMSSANELVGTGFTSRDGAYKRTIAVNWKE